MACRVRLRGFTLVEAMVAVGVVALLAGILLPALGHVRAAASDGRCASQLRECFLLSRMHADEHDGVGPAIGQPYASPPNWALVVLQRSGHEGATPGDLYRQDSILVCPSADAFYPMDMVRTYAMNGTGHAGEAMGDGTDYDASDPALRAHIRFDLVERPSRAVLLLDGAVAGFASNPAPSNRCASVVDFRQAAHVEDRIGRFHALGGRQNRGRFNAVNFDGAAGPFESPEPHWLEPLP